MKQSLVVVCALLMSVAVAWGQPKTADDWYKEGSTQYNLGDFDKAAEAFKQAFSLETNDAKKPAYLYNVAQAYRQGQKCKDAVFFYKRFISLKDSGMGKPLSDETRKKTEELIAEAEQCAKQAETTAQKLPDTTMTPESGSGSASVTVSSGSAAGSGSLHSGASGSGSGSGSATTKVASHDEGSGEDEGESNEAHATGSGAPHLFVARILGGPAKIDTGGLSIPLETTFTLIAGYPIAITPEITIEAGAAVTYTAVPYQNNSGNTLMTQTASFTDILANGAVTYKVTPKIYARGEIGLGVQMFSGVAAGSPFTENGAGTSGALGAFALRVGASVEYAITNNIHAVLAPLTFSYSPATTGLADNVKSFARVDVLVGVGYQM